MDCWRYSPGAFTFHNIELKIESINYKNMPTWNSRGLRGSTLEELINLTNELYTEKNLALMQKIPTPITPVKIDSESGQIKLAYFEKDSTVDYIGVVQGIPVCFDAKECATDTFPLRNIHEHQIRFMRQFEKQHGVSFLLVMFTARNEFYYLRLCELETYLARAAQGHAKNFKYEELNPAYFIKSQSGAPIHYLKGLQLDLQERED